MTNPENQFKINLNQNLWGLVVGLSALGLAERFTLRLLFYFGIAISIIMVISVCFTTIAYTIDYWRNRLN